MTSFPPLAERSRWRVANGPRYPPSPQPEGLLESEPSAFPVRMTILRGGVLTGWDDGALGFEEDAVWFSGRACSFRIFAQDLHRLPRDVAMSQRLALPIQDGRGSVYVHLAALSVPDRSVPQDENRIESEIRRLRTSRRQGGTSQYPPLAPRPGLIDPLFVWLTFRRRAGLAALCALPAFVWPNTPAMFGLFGAGALLVGGSSAYRLRQRTLLEIAREESMPRSEVS